MDKLMENPQLSAMNPPKPGSRRARRAAERAAAAAARREAHTGEIPQIGHKVAVAPVHTHHVTIEPAVPFAEKMNEELVISLVEKADNQRSKRKGFMVQGMGASSIAAAVAVGLGFGLVVEHLPADFAVAASASSASELATASVSLNENTPIIEGVTIPFTVEVDGRVTKLASSSRFMLADALAAAGIKVNLGDIVSEPLNEPVARDAKVKITRVTTDEVIQTFVVEPETKREDDATLPEGEEKTVTEGKPGEGTRTVVVTKHDGVEVDRKTVVEVVTTPAVSTVVKVGTKKKPKFTPPANATPVAPGTARAIAAELVTARGWSSAEFACLDQLWNRESHWNHLAANPGSGAYGIPQALPGSKMASAGADWQTNPATQIKWGLGYIAGRYGTPCGAWQHSETVGWY